MKFLLLVLAILFSISGVPGEKGNGLDDVFGLHDQATIDRVLEAALEVKKRTLKEMAQGRQFTLESQEIQRYSALIRIFILNDEEELLSDLTTGHASFYEAFQRQGKTFSLSFWEKTKAGVVRDSGIHKWKEFSLKLDASRLGHDLP